MILTSVPVRAHDEHFLVHSQVLSVPAAYISANSTIWLLFQKALHYRPRLNWVSQLEAREGGVTHTL